MPPTSDFPTEKYLSKLHARKDFQALLWRLYNSPVKSPSLRFRILGRTSQELLNLLIETVFFVTTGRIRMHNTHEGFLNRSSSKQHLLQNFRGVESVQKLIKGSRESKIDALGKITCYHQLLFLFFNKRNKK
jgi:hypothetical protein